MIMALGDCNIVGAKDYRGKNYVDIVAEKLGMEQKNYGITMSTTREGLILYREHSSPKPDVLLIAYGLVDSWKTFKYAPYVLYYPDNPLRKIARKIVKKYKKSARKLGLNELLGQKYVVPPKEYRSNIEKMVGGAKCVLLIETPPHQTELFRNSDIQKYNAILADIAAKYPHVDVVQLYDVFSKHPEYYFDEIHLNEAGYRFVANKILEKL